MIESSEARRPVARLWKTASRLAKFVTIVTTLVGGGVGAVAVARWVGQTRAHWSDVELSASLPGETWQVADLPQYSWLQGDWCYPSLPGFRSTFRVMAGSLQRQNRSTGAEKFVTEWVNTNVHISNRGLLRLDYEGKVWPLSFVDAEPGHPTEWRENERYPQDDGSSRAGNKRLVLSCSQCVMSRDGMTYSCH